MHLKKGLAARCWENVLFAIIGEQVWAFIKGSRFSIGDGLHSPQRRRRGGEECASENS